MTEIVSVAEQAPEGGYTARALGYTRARHAETGHFERRQK